MYGVDAPARDALGFASKRSPNDFGNGNATLLQVRDQTRVLGAETNIDELHDPKINTICLYSKPLHAKKERPFSSLPVQ